jgi:pilus assembly protein CpaB
LSTKVPKGKRAITVPVDNISSVGGMIRPGDHVDVMGMVPLPAMTADGKQVTQMTTMPLFQDVLVLAVGQEFTNVPGGEKKERVLSPVITLALQPQEANLIAFVQEQGKIRLILRSPEDTQVQPAMPASWDALLRTVMPQAFQQAGTKEIPKPKKTVEIYRGLQKEIKTLE